MKQRSASLLFLCICLSLAHGCAVVPESVRTSAWMKRPFASQLDSQIVQLDVHLLERPLDDPFVNDELWQHADEMIVPLDRKAAVVDNGYRVGQIVGMTPGKLHELLASKRYCLNSRRHVLPSGNTVQLYLGPAWPRCELVVQEGKQPVPTAFDQARFCLDVKAIFAKDGKTRLTFTPKVEHGELTLPFQADPDQQSWTIRIEKPSKSYPDLGWDVALASGELLVIGAVATKENSLGHRSFINDNLVQRLLVLRANRAPSGSPTGEPTLEDVARSQPSPCLAIQASMTTARASVD